ncbi:MAG: aldo/keto reductase [Ignavibacteriales bacterium]|nr:aldo/keto reductase [Ignavibacteriales bacterium]
MEGFSQTVALGATGLRTSRLGLSASYRPGVRAVHRALDEGINFFFGYGIDTQLSKGLREAFRSNRDKHVLATGAYNLLIGYPNLRRTLERRLRQFRTDYIDVFLFLGVTDPKQFPRKAIDEMMRFREEGKVRSIGMSCHDRKFVGKLASEGALDVMMMRYNAAHRSAEMDIFPYLRAHQPGIVSYTATRWTALIRRTKGWPKDGRIPDAGMCYRFVLSNPHVHVCLTAPSNEGQLVKNLEVLRQGPLNEEEMHFMKQYGDAVYNRHQWFM